MSMFRGALATLAVLGSIGAMAQPKQAPTPPAQPVPIVLDAATQETLRRSLNLPPGSSFDVEAKHTEGGYVKTRDEGEGLGAGARTEGGVLDSHFTGSPPSVGRGADGSVAAEGGGSESDAKAKGFVLPPVPWKNPLFWVGLGLLGGCGFCVYSHLRRGAMICGVAGVGCLAAAFYPVILLFAVAGVVAVLAAPYIKAELEKLRSHEALRGVAEGVDDPGVPQSAKDAVKAAIAKATTLKDRAVIQAVKLKDQLGKYAD